jgi:hypothetical protein
MVKSKTRHFTAILEAPEITETDKGEDPFNLLEKVD